MNTVYDADAFRFATGQGGMMHPLDKAEAYDALSPAEQGTLLEWIRLAIQPARRIGNETSYALKHDFEEDGFYVSNGEFKGAMLAAGYAPTASTQDELNWRFAVRPRDKKCRRAGHEGTGYGLLHLTDEERAEFAILAKIAQRAQEARWKKSYPPHPHGPSTTPNP